MPTKRCPLCGKTASTSTPKPESEMTHSERAGVSYKVWLETAPLSQMSPSRPSTRKTTGPTAIKGEDKNGVYSNLHQVPHEDR